MRWAWIALGIAPAIAGLADARADHGPALVVPGRPNIPVPINGYNAAWGVVEGDWGLYRPGAAPGVTVYPSPFVPPLEPEKPVRYRPAARYFPTLGTQPFIGRLEIEPPENRPMPKPAEAYSRSWSAESPDVPPTQYAPSPPMMISPEVNVGSPWDQQGGAEDQRRPRNLQPPRRR
ncbi:hypothetical protein [Pseudorhodoplanes sp.]|jgi:hypothetical protein|uniref:hypothetical protein n=1 Tax=Pseudorhodoplanes sp. TaxID=1934341 RepID=UPI002C7F6805|nr:hypothetical protein [Pseudorhodoplanes sp.]HWV40439.1 hypothetical protein [Pseudorhodoplanes sp.]